VKTAAAQLTSTSTVHRHRACCGRVHGHGHLHPTTPPFVVRVAVTRNQSYCTMLAESVSDNSNVFRQQKVSLLDCRSRGWVARRRRPSQTTGQSECLHSITANASFTNHYIKQLHGHRRKIPQRRCCCNSTSEPTGRGRRCGHCVVCSSSCEGPFDPQHAPLGSELSRSVPSAPSVPSLSASIRAACLLVIA
jgi:hypothetical protein